jgi:hypothetical protein
MAIDFDDFIEEQRAAILAESAMSHVPPIVALKSIQLLTDRARVAAGVTPPARLVPIGGPVRGWVQETPAYKSFWAATENDGYRGDYCTFLNEHCGFSLSGIPTAYDIDHLYNRERARVLGYRWIRMFPVRRGPNRSHGAAYEKAITRSSEGRFAKIMKLMDEISFMKFLDLTSPGKARKLSGRQQAHLQRMAALFNLPQRMLVDNVQGLLDRAYGG